MKQIITLIITFFTLNVVAQQNKRLDLSVSYFGYNVVHQGMKVGGQLGLKSWKKKKQKKKGEVIKQKQFFFSPQIGFYRHIKNHDGILYNTEYGIETSKSGRFYSAHAIGVGFINNLLSGSTYSLNNDGTLHEEKNDRTGYIITSYNFEIGQHFNSKFSWFFKASIASKLFYNMGMSFNTFQECGIKYRLF